MLLFGRLRRRHHWYNTDPVPTGRRGRSLVRAFGRDRLSLRRSVPRAVSVLPHSALFRSTTFVPTGRHLTHLPPPELSTGAAAVTLKGRTRRIRTRAPLLPPLPHHLFIDCRSWAATGPIRRNTNGGVKGTREGHSLKIPPDTNRSDALSGFYERGGTHPTRSFRGCATPAASGCRRSPPDTTSVRP